MRTHGREAGRVAPAALSAADTAAYVGLSRASVWRLCGDEARKNGSTFPLPVPLSPGRRAWLRDELDQWLEQRRAARDAGAAS